MVLLSLLASCHALEINTSRHRHRYCKNINEESPNMLVHRTLKKGRCKPDVDCPSHRQQSCGQRCCTASSSLLLASLHQSLWFSIYPDRVTAKSSHDGSTLIFSSRMGHWVLSCVSSSDPVSTICLLASQQTSDQQKHSRPVRF